MAKRFRFSAVIPLVFSAVSFALAIVLLLAGTKVGTGQDMYLIQLNTSKIGSDLIEFKPVTSTPTTTSSPTSTSSSSFASLTSSLGSIFDPNGVLEGLDSVVNNVTERFDTALQNLESNLVTNLTKSLGIRDVYSIYMRDICEGDYTTEDDASTATYDTCTTYADKGSSISNFPGSFKSYIIIGTTNISVPLFEQLGPGLSSLGTTVSFALTANVVFLVIGMVTSGLVAAVSLAAMVLARSQWLVRAALLFSGIAPGALMVSALFVTVVAEVFAEFVNGLGGALTVGGLAGRRAVAVVWVAWALSNVAAWYWQLAWLVSYRRTTVVRLPRNPDEVGRWGATFKQLRSDLRDPRKLQRDRETAEQVPDSPRRLLTRAQREK